MKTRRGNEACKGLALGKPIREETARWLTVDPSWNRMGHQPKWFFVLHSTETLGRRGASDFSHIPLAAGMLKALKDRTGAL